MITGSYRIAKPKIVKRTHQGKCFEVRSNDLKCIEPTYLKTLNKEKTSCLIQLTRLMRKYNDIRWKAFVNCKPLIQNNLLPNKDFLSQIIKGLQITIMEIRSLKTTQRKWKICLNLLHQIQCRDPRMRQVVPRTQNLRKHVLSGSRKLHFELWVPSLPHLSPQKRRIYENWVGV